MEGKKGRKDRTAEPLYQMMTNDWEDIGYAELIYSQTPWTLFIPTQWKADRNGGLFLSLYRNEGLFLSSREEKRSLRMWMFFYEVRLGLSAENETGSEDHT